jgi:hypothetical protein
LWIERRKGLIDRQNPKKILNFAGFCWVLLEKLSGQQRLLTSTAKQRFIMRKAEGKVKRTERLLIGSINVFQF